MGADVARWLEPIAGAVLVATVLVDVFLTVLYARVDTGFLSTWMNRTAWRAVRLAATRASGPPSALLDFGGPLLLVWLLFVWAVLQTIGAALILHPALGSGVQASSGRSDTDFITALYVAGSSMSIVGASDYEPQTGAYRIVFLFDSLVGVSMASLAVTYLMQVYNAVRTSNNAALRLHLASGESGDAAELIAAWAPRGEFAAGYTDISNVASQVTSVKESHHFYPVLFYFRFPEVYYSVPRIGLVALDALALLRAAVDDETHGWMKSSAAVNELQGAANLLVSMLDNHFAHAPPGTVESADEAQLHEVWRARYRRGVARLRAAGIATRSTDDDRGERDYVERRAEWDGHIRSVAATLGFPMAEVDPAAHAAGRLADAAKSGRA